MKQIEVNSRVAQIILKSRTFHQTGSLARKLGVQRPSILEAFDVLAQAYPDKQFLRIRGMEAGGMGRW
jgi:hypothetical protein